MLPAHRQKWILLLPGPFVTPPANDIVSLACGHMARRRVASCVAAPHCSSQRLYVPDLAPYGVVLFAPCSFNSLNKLAHGIADNLPLSLVAEAIGRGAR